jgi:hypothetical protein
LARPAGILQPYRENGMSEWVWVPRKLTEEMRAACPMVEMSQDADFAWERMVDAAPAQPAEEPVAWLTADGSESCTAGDKEMWLQQDDMKNIAAEHCIPCYITPPSVGQIKAQALRELAARHKGWTYVTFERIEELASKYEREGK